MFRVYSTEDFRHVDPEIMKKAEEFENKHNKLKYIWVGYPKDKESMQHMAYRFFDHKYDYKSFIVSPYPGYATNIDQLVFVILSFM